MLIGVMLTVSFSNIFDFNPLAFDNKFALEVCAVLVLYLIGVYDDLIGVRYSKKFIAQILGSILIILSDTYIRSFNGLFGIESIPAWLGIALTVFLIVFITNAFNLIDGIDGLATSLSITALTVFGILFLATSQHIEALFAFSTIGVLIPFLYFNLFKVKRNLKTKIIMGDSGSLTLGFIMSIMTLKIWGATSVNISHETAEFFHIMAFTVLVIPCFDVVRVALHRAKSHAPIFLPDKNHFHHKLMALNLSPRKTLKYILFINFTFLLVNSALSYITSITFIVIIDIVIWTIMHIIITNKVLKRQATEEQ